MEDTKKKFTEKDKIKQILDNENISQYKWFFGTFNNDERKEIFEIIYNNLFKENQEEEIKDYPKNLKDYIKAKDLRYYNKTNKEIILSFKEKEEDLNKSLEKFNIRLIIEYNYYLYLEDNEKKNFIKITCLRNIRFGEQYEWICNPLYLLYFQYYIMNYSKPSRVQSIYIKGEEDEEEEGEEEGEEEEEIVDTIDSVSKANQILKNENFIYIKDTPQIDFKKIFEDGNEEFSLLKDNILKYLDYNSNDEKQIIGCDKIYNNNYDSVIDFCFEIHFDNFIYGFHNGYYFFELNLINCLNLYIINKNKFFYMNFSKIKKIFNNKNNFKQYLIFWLAKLFLVQEKVDTIKYYEFVNNLIDSIFKNKANYLEIILNKLNESFPKNNNIVSDNSKILDKKILIILNNIDISDLQWIEKKKFSNLNILFIFNIQDNFDVFQSFYHEQTKLKKFFLENEDEISYRDPYKEGNNDNFYSIFQTKDEYENSKKKLIERVFNGFKTEKDKLLNLAFILNISEIIDRFNNKTCSIIKLKINLGIDSNIQMLKPFCPLINLYVSVNGNTKFNIDNIMIKEIFIYNQMKKLYLSKMISYLNQNSTELFLDDIKGPLLEKDIILNILTGQINLVKYSHVSEFKEIKVRSLYCLDQNKSKQYEDNKDNNVIITQDSKTAEFYDFAFKIKNYMKFGQISISKNENDLEKLNKEAIILDLINFDLNKGKLNLGKIDNYSFAIITSINVFNEYKKLSKNKMNHTFFLMKEHCKKNNFEFYIYNYFENNFYIYKEDCDNIEKFQNFFNDINKIDFFDKNLQLYKFIESSNKKISLKLTKNDLLNPLKIYYQINEKRKIVFKNLAKYEFNPSMLNMFSGINNIGFAFWNYGENKQIEYLQINLNEKINYFKGNKINKIKPIIFENTNKFEFHALLFLLTEEEIKEDEKKNPKKLLNKKRRKAKEPSKKEKK